ncbi:MULTISPECIES: helix-turn-helix domain-containing protein [Proteus]|uniref:helix-turn-helix domain-containing protein n=1 Tax=Proteus TaxID=583 RepID=UPI000D6902B4|nr:MULTISPECIES: helix-turn-helix transcriptional regulator [Proteus]MBG5950106.1 helix-turn-helix transcriptional regulator [Proteus terrae]MCE9841322.1 helix-turn-helix transcriptional regulator [Proteus terrae]NBN71839.1 helix-turn-helix domain-containing protein [Proteus sp. G2618]
MSSINIVVGQRIKQKRKQLKITGIEIARRLGISQQHYSRLENGHLKITVDQLIAIALILGISPQSLLITPEIMSPMLNAWAETTLSSNEIVVSRNKKRRNLR